MSSIDVIVDRTMPPNTVLATADGGAVTVSVAPNVTAEVLALPAEKVGEAVVEVVVREA